MKINKFLTVCTLLLSFNLALAFAIPADPGKKDAITEITSLLQNPGISTRGKDMLANVYLMVNRDGEIVVLQVQAENDLMEAYIKNRLNYKKLKTKALTPGKEYMVPVRIKSSF